MNVVPDMVEEDEEDFKVTAKRNLALTAAKA